MDSFKLYRVLIMIWTCLSMVGALVVAILSHVIATSYVNAIPKDPHINQSGTITTVMIVFIVVCVISFAVNMVGFLGAKRCHYCMSVFYTVFLLIGVIGSFINIFTNLSSIAGVILGCIELYICIMFCKELKLRREQGIASPYPPPGQNAYYA